MNSSLRNSLQASGAILFLVTTVSCLTQSVARSGSNPRSAERESVSWMTVPTDSGIVRVAIARPDGRGPFPTVLILHGTHGFAEEYVQFARDLARGGVLSFAACWFDRGAGAGVRFVRPIACDGAPRFTDAPGLDRFRVARNTIDALVARLRTSPDVRFGKLALVGHSRGGGAALDYASSHPTFVAALVLNSVGYPDEAIVRAHALRIPVLIMHGEADDPRDGGSSMTTPARARRFEDGLRKGGTVVESKYYQGGHNSLFTDTTQYRDAVRRIVGFVHGRASR